VCGYKYLVLATWPTDACYIQYNLA